MYRWDESEEMSAGYKRKSAFLYLVIVKQSNSVGVEDQYPKYSSWDVERNKDNGKSYPSIMLTKAPKKKAAAPLGLLRKYFIPYSFLSVRR